MNEESPPPEEPLWSGYVDGGIVIPGVLALSLLLAAPLLWVGTHGIPDGLLVLFWGGILAIVIGAVLAFIVGVFVLGSVAIAGILWLVLERAALAFGPGFGWSAAALALLGVLLLPSPYRRLRAVAAARHAWKGLKGGSVPP